MKCSKDQALALVISCAQACIIEQEKKGHVWASKVITIDVAV